MNKLNFALFSKKASLSFACKVIFALILFIPSVVFALDTTDAYIYPSYDNNYITEFIDYANYFIPNFSSMKYVIYKVSESRPWYYLVAGYDYILSGSELIFTKPYFIRYYADDTTNFKFNTNSLQGYDKASVFLSLKAPVISNIPLKNYTLPSKRFVELKSQYDLRNIGIFILGLVFAIFLTKERRY